VQDLEKYLDSGGSKPRPKDWVKKLEAATGKRIELRRHHTLNRRGDVAEESAYKPPLTKMMLVMRCSKWMKDFYVMMERETPDERFRVSSILKARPSAIVTSSTHELDDDVSVDFGEVDLRGLRCPYCGDGGIVKCSCDRLGCGGGIEGIDDRRFYICPWCGEGGYITHPIKNLKASRIEESKPPPGKSGWEALRKGDSSSKDRLPPSIT